jgi:hypothetical protein
MKPICNFEAILTAELARKLRQVEVGNEFPILPSAAIRNSLELFIPSVFRRDYPEWTHESLDAHFWPILQFS